jgi:hypothetical protein
MARIEYETLTASGNKIITLNNIRGKRNIYTVQLFGGFGGGTVTAFINGAGTAGDGTTDDIAILDAEGVAISKTAKTAFDFECNSDPVHPNKLKIILTGATNPTLTIRVDNGK